MPEEPTTPTTTSSQPDPQAQPVTTPASGEATKTFTEAEVNAMVTARLAKQEKALKAQLEAEATKAAERAKLDEVERIKAEKADVEKRAVEAEARAAAAERRAALTGKVIDPIAALKLLDDAKHLTDDGAVNTDALLADYPFLALKTSGAPATPGAGGTLTGKTAALATLQERLEKARSREERIALQDEILKLKKG